ncbi:MAG: M12 family metallo-peptidase [Chloroflexota bacterium]
MSRERFASGSFSSLAIALVILLSSTATAAAGKPPTWPDPPGFVPEVMPPPPTTSADVVTYLSLSDHPPVFETQGDVTAQVVVFNNWIKAVGDDEFRAAFPAGWDDKINTALERADDEMYVQFGIDFRVYSIQQWDSWPDGTRTCGSFLTELQSEVGIGTGDTVAGYTAHTLWSDSSGGCRSGNYIIVKRQNTNETVEKKNRWVVTQHEYGHIYGAPDRYPDPNNLHPNDVMEDPYNYYDFWCTAPGYNDHGIIYSNRDQFE